jgi:hypothetical protein
VENEGAPNKYMVADLRRRLVAEIDPNAEVCLTEQGVLIRLSRRIGYAERNQISSWIRPFPFTTASRLGNPPAPRENSAAVCRHHRGRDAKPHAHKSYALSLPDHAGISDRCLDCA